MASGRKLTVGLGVILLAGVLGWLAIAERSAGRGLGPGAAVRPDAGGGAEGLAEPAAGPQGAPRTSVAAAPAAAPAPDVVEAPAAAPETGRVRLRGVLLHSKDRRPAPGAELVLHFAEEYERVTTDAEGRFVTGRRIVPGTVRPWHLADAAQPDYAVHLDVEPRLFAVPEGDAAGEVPPVELALRSPDAWVEVEVQLPGGGPAGGARAVHQETRFVEADSGPVRGARHVADERGRVRVAVTEGPLGARLELIASLGETQVSEVARLERPWPELPVVLQLEAGGRIAVRALDEAGRPVPGLRLLMRPADGLNAFGAGGARRTDDEGRALFDAVLPGAYRVLDYLPELGEWSPREVQVEAGQLAELQLEIPLLALNLAAAGRVLDEEGRALPGVELSLEHGDGRVAWQETDDEGRFEFRAPDCPLVVVATDRDPWADSFEPARSEVPFGTTGIELRRTATVPESEYLLEVVDARSGERLREACVLGYRAPSRENYGLHDARDGLVHLRYKPLEGLIFCVTAHGYRRRHVRPSELASAGAPGPLRVELTPGLVQTVYVVAAESGEPIDGATLAVDGVRLATTGLDGRAAVDLLDWPALLLVTTPGRSPIEVDPAEWLRELADPRVRLEPGGSRDEDG